MPRNPTCKDCDLYKSSTNVCVWGDGPKNATVMVVGEAPGAAEAKTGKPFQGESGQLLRAELAKAGINDVYITNVVKCRPPDNRTPSVKEQNTCKHYLEEEIATVKPRYVLTLGNPATKAVFRKAKITEVHGQILNKDGVVGMPAFHPAYCLRDPSKLPIFQKDLLKFSDLLKGIKKKSSIRWKLVTPENLDEFLSELDSSEWFSFDVETTGLDWFADNFRLNSLQMCLDATYTSWVFPFHPELCKFPSEESRRSVLKIVAAKARKKKGVGHGGKFDNLCLYATYKITFPLTFDTLLASHTLDENNSPDLKSRSAFELDAPGYDLSTAEKKGNVEPMKLYRYGAKDACYTLQLKDTYLPRLQKNPDLWRLFDRLVMRASRALFRVDRNGLYVNLEKRDETARKVIEELKILKREMDQEVMKLRKTRKLLNWNSPAQVAELFFGDLGLEPIEYTAGGKASTGEATLVALKDAHPLVNKLVRYRELEKFHGTYIEGWKPWMNGPMVYFSTKVHGTVTGRYSSRLHQTPRNGTIRNIVEAPPGWVFVQADFSQAELRIAAILSRDPEMIKCFNEGIDIHWRTLLHVILTGGAGEYVKPLYDTAEKILGKPASNLTHAARTVEKHGHEKCIKLWEGWKEARKKAKGINFGFVYGMKENKFIEYAKIKYGFEPSEQEAREIRTAYFSLYRGLTAWHEKQKQLVKVDGYVRNLAGRVRRLPGIYSKERSMKAECERQAINSPVQGVIGDIKAMALVELVEKLDWDRARVVGEVHDSILLWIREQYVDEQLTIVERIMRNPELIREFKINLPVPIETEFEVGPWGKGVKWIPK